MSKFSLLLHIRYEEECMVKGEHTVLLLALLYEPGVSSTGEDSDVFKVQCLCLLLVTTLKYDYHSGDCITN